MLHQKHIARGCNLFYTGSDDGGCHRSSPLGKKYDSTMSHPQIEKESPAVTFFHSNYRKSCIFISIAGVISLFFPFPVVNFALFSPITVSPLLTREVQSVRQLAKLRLKSCLFQDVKSVSEKNPVTVMDFRNIFSE